MNTSTVQRNSRPERQNVHGLHSYQGRQALERSLARIKHRLGHPRFIEASR